MTSREILDELEFLHVEAANEIGTAADLLCEGRLLCSEGLDDVTDSLDDVIVSGSRENQVTSVM